MKKAAKIILINPENKIMLYLRDNTKGLRYPGYWDFIGGEIERGEPALETIKREIREEIPNVFVEGIEKLGEVYFKKENKFDSCKVYLFKGYFGEFIDNIKLKEGQMIGVFDIKEIEYIKLPEKYKSIILENKEQWIK